MDSASPRLVTDRDALYNALHGNPVSTCYMLGDLEASYSDQATWYCAGKADRLDAIVLVYAGLSAPVMITWGQTGPLEQIFEAFTHDLPGRCLVHLQPHHVSPVDAYFSTDGLVPMLRMGMPAADFRPSDAQQFEITQLTHRHTGDIAGLYQHYYPDNYFEPAQLDSGHYYGILDADGGLLSVAGVHLVSPRASIAVLGNIVTHPDHRGSGMSTACTSHLCARLFEEGMELLALNVRRQNRSAVRVYEKLGFRYHDTYLEGLVHRTAP